MVKQFTILTSWLSFVTSAWIAVLYPDWKWFGVAFFWGVLTYFVAWWGVKEK